MFMIVTASPGWAQTPASDAVQQWRALNAQVSEAYRAGDYARGAKLAEQALDMSQKAFGNRASQTMASLNNLALLYEVQGRYAEAEPLYQQALQATRETLGPRHPSTLVCLGNLAELYREQGRYAEAEQFHRDALQARREVLGPRHRDTLNSVNNLALVYEAQGRHREAEPLYLEALQGRREVLGPRDRDTLVSVANVAGLYREQGRYGEAEPLYQEALQGNREVLGPRHPDTLSTLSSLALLYRDQGRYREAEPLYQEALQARRERLGTRHPDTVASINNLADLYRHQGRYREAEPLFQEALRTSREVRGPRHPDTLIFLNNLGDLYRVQGRYGEAEPLLQEVLRARREVLGPRHPDTVASINNLAFLYRWQGRFAEAEPLFREALQIFREVRGPRHPNTLGIMGNLAEQYRLQGRYPEAEPLFQEVLQARREVLGALHPDTLTSLDDLAQLYSSQGRYGEAEPMFQEVLKARRDVLGARHPVASLGHLAELYRHQGRYGEAERLYREALQASREEFGPRHPSTLAGLSDLAALHVLQHRYDEAERLYREALDATREALGPRHPDMLTGLGHLAMIYMDQGRYGEAEPLLRDGLQASREILGPRHPDTLTSINNLATLYLYQSRFDEAASLYQEALQANREVLGPRHPATLTSLHNVALLYQSEPLFRELLQAMRETLGPRHPLTLTTQLDMAVLLVNLDRRAEAVQTLQQMESNLLDRIGQELYSSEAGAARRQMVSSQATFQDTVLSLAMAAPAGDALRLASAVMLRFKLMQGEEEAWLARLARQSKDPQVQTLASDIRKLRGTLAAAAQGAPDAFEKTLQALEAKRRELIDASPEYRDRLRVQDADPGEVRKALPAGAVLIEFRQFRPHDFRSGKPGEPRFAGLLLTGSGEPVVADLGPVSEVQSLTTAMAAPRAPRGLGADPAGAPLSLDDQAAAKLYERLFAPFKRDVDSATVVYVAPDGILNLVPFARLKLSDGRYWFERQEVRTLQTGRDLLRPAADHPARGLLALGGIDFGAPPTDTGPQDSPIRGLDEVGRGLAAVNCAAKTFPAFSQLPATAGEVKEVMEWYHSRHADEPAEIWTGSDASKARLMALRTPPRVLHLATHGFYLPNQSCDLPNRSREPMLLSGIVLAGANRRAAGTGDNVAGSGNEGLLFALEAEGLNLDGTELVVLSACDTAKGDVDYSEGVFGLARALRTAGARNVLVTLWPLDDQMARDFMVDFYQNWLGQTRSDPARALRDTQLDWIKRRDHSDPRIWAPYVVVE
jgi:tetratricopeptide (TPR) repeat protein